MPLSGLPEENSTEVLQVLDTYKKKDLSKGNDLYPISEGIRSPDVAMNSARTLQGNRECPDHEDEYLPDHGVESFPSRDSILEKETCLEGR